MEGKRGREEGGNEREGELRFGGSMHCSEIVGVFRIPRATLERNSVRTLFLWGERKIERRNQIKTKKKEEKKRIDNQD